MKSSHAAVFWLVLWMGAAPACRGQEVVLTPPVVSESETAPLSFAPAVRRAAPATVVVVVANQLPAEHVREFQALPEEGRRLLLDTRRVIEWEKRFYKPTGHGSGFIVDNEGHLLTNHHVVEAQPDEDRPDRILADACFVGVGDDTVWQPARVVGVDPSTDLAVLKLSSPPAAVAAWGDSSKLEPGDVVLAIGAPLDANLRQTVTMGIVSAVARASNGLRYEDFVQTDAAINGGNSGGPLINARGEVVGVNQSIRLGRVSTADGSLAMDPRNLLPLRAEGNLGIGFAISSNLARRIATEIIQEGTVRRGYLGVKLERQTPEASPMGVTLEFGLSTLDDTSGLHIVAVLPGSPAEKSGLRPGDRVLLLNQQPVPSVERFHLAISLTPPGEKVALRISRGKELRNVEPVLEDLARSPYAAIGFDPLSLPCPRLEGVEIVAGIARNPFDRESGSVLVIRSVQPGSPAFKAGLRAGMLIAEVAGVPVRTPAEFAAAATTSVQDGHLLLRLQGRGFDREISVPVAP